MPVYPSATATLLAGTRTRGVARRGRESSCGAPVMYAKPGANPRKATRWSARACRRARSLDEERSWSAYRARTAPSTRWRTSTESTCYHGSQGGSRAQDRRRQQELLLLVDARLLDGAQDAPALRGGGGGARPARHGG